MLHFKKQRSGSKNCGTIAIMNALRYCGYKPNRRTYNKISKRNKDNGIKGVKRNVFNRTIRIELGKHFLKHGYFKNKKHFLQLTTFATKHPNLGIIIAFHNKRGGHMSLLLDINHYQKKIVLINSGNKVYHIKKFSYIDKMLKRGNVDYWLFQRYL